MTKTTIEWTHMPGFAGDVWNPTTGCTRVSAGCDNCYAFALHDQRYAANLAFTKGHGHMREILENGAMREMFREDVGVKGGLSRSPQYDLPFSRVQLLEDRLDVPLRTRKPTCYFVDSMADLFHEDVPDEFLDRVFATMMRTPRHRFLILTKRPERMRAYLTWERLDLTRRGAIQNQSDFRWARQDLIGGKKLGEAGERPVIEHWPLPNVWLGTSVEDQRAADERIPHLLATPAAVRFLSCEPLLGPVDLTAHLGHPSYCGGQYNGLGFVDAAQQRHRARCVNHGMRLVETTVLHGPYEYVDRIDWVIVGGESGNRARPMDLQWARSLRDQCRTAGVPVFVKQLGDRPQIDGIGVPTIRSRKGGEIERWPEDLRVREWPR